MREDEKTVVAPTSLQPQSGGYVSGRIGDSEEDWVIHDALEQVTITGISADSLDPDLQSALLSESAPELVAAVAEEKEMKSYVHTFSAFGGCDLIVVLNGEAIGETQEVRFTEDFAPRREDPSDPFSKMLLPIQGVMETVMFDRSAVREKIKGHDDTLWLLFSNEYGSLSAFRFVDLKFLTRKLCFSVDHVVFGEEYRFEAQSFENEPRAWESFEEDGKIKYRFVKVI